jgi:uncharacterized membrane protein
MVTGWFMVAALLLAVFATPMARGMLPPNHWYGFRTPRIVADQRLWYPANAMAGRVLWTLASVMAVTGALFGLGLLSEAALTVAAVVPPALAVVIMFYRASVMAAALDAAPPREPAATLDDQAVPQRAASRAARAKEEQR